MNASATPARGGSGRFQRLYARSVFFPTLLWNCLLGRWLKVRHWWDPIDPAVLVGGYPFTKDAARLHAIGVRAVVNTCEEYAGPVAEYERLGMTQLRIPTTDFTHPSLPDVRKAVDFVHRHVENGDKVYIHCKAGRARSATIALCWLVRDRGMTPSQAQAHLLAMRPHINPSIDQRPVVAQYVAEISPNSAESGPGAAAADSPDDPGSGRLA
jgi:atypical dual specificity phosphatase